MKHATKNRHAKKAIHKSAHKTNEIKPVEQPAEKRQSVRTYQDEKNWRKEQQLKNQAAVV